MAGRLRRLRRPRVCTRVASAAPPAAACSMAPRPVWPRRHRLCAKGMRPFGADVLRLEGGERSRRTAGLPGGCEAKTQGV